MHQTVQVLFFCGPVVRAVVSHLESCWVLGFHNRVDFWLENSDSPSIYTCLACCSDSRSLLVVTVLVISFFLVVDEGFVSLYVGGGASICGWLRYLEVLGNNL